MNSQGIYNVVEVVYLWLHTAGFQFGDKSKLPLALSLVDEEVQEMKDAVANKDVEELCDSLGDIFFVCLNTMYFYGVKMEDVGKKFEQIVQSNYSKFCQTREEAMLSAEAYIKGQHPTKLNQEIPAKYESTGNKDYPFVIKHAVSGKLLKALSYKSPEEF